MITLRSGWLRLRLLCGSQSDEITYSTGSCVEFKGGYPAESVECWRFGGWDRPRPKAIPAMAGARECAGLGAAGISPFFSALWLFLNALSSARSCLCFSSSFSPFLDILWVGDAFVRSPSHAVGQPGNTRQPHDLASRHRHRAWVRGKAPSTSSQHGFWRPWRHVVRRTVLLFLIRKNVAQGRRSVRFLRYNVRDHSPRLGCVALRYISAHMK